MFTIITSNIRFDNPKDGIHQWCHRREVLAKTITRWQPTILGTQEGRKEQIQDLHSLLNLNMASGHRQWIEERMYPTIFYSPQKVELIKSGDFWLSMTPDVPGSSSFGSMFPRLCTWIKAKERESGLEFYFFNTHLDHLKSEIRQKQVAVMLQQIEQINQEELAIILCGDFNESPDGMVRRLIHSSKFNLYDPWETLGLEERPTHKKLNGEEIAASRIDWTMLSPTLRVHSTLLDMNEISGISPSDHFPVITKIEF